MGASIFTDVLYMAVCGCCLLCQELNELDIRDTALASAGIPPPRQHTMGGSSTVFVPQPQYGMPMQQPGVAPTGYYYPQGAAGPGVPGAPGLAPGYGYPPPQPGYGYPAAQPGQVMMAPSGAAQPKGDNQVTTVPL